MNVKSWDMRIVIRDVIILSMLVMLIVASIQPDHRTEGELEFDTPIVDNHLDSQDSQTTMSNDENVINQLKHLEQLINNMAPKYKSNAESHVDNSPSINIEVNLNMLDDDHSNQSLIIKDVLKEWQKAENASQGNNKPQSPASLAANQQQTNHMSFVEYDKQLAEIAVDLPSIVTKEGYRKGIEKMADISSQYYREPIQPTPNEIFQRWENELREYQKTHPEYESYVIKLLKSEKK